MPIIRWRVVCALKVAIEMRSPTKTFINVDLPTFGFPTIFTKPALCMTSVFELRQKNASNRNRMRFYHIIFSNSMLLLLSVVSPLHIHGSPGKSCAECSENKVVAFLQLIFKVPDAKRQRSSTGIAVTFDINQYFLTRNFQTMCHSINDTKICLLYTSDAADE